ncbi:MAG: GLPGLI family protein [Alistipes sp.]|nr:GLPGLI family protein [Alistipes sp.]
MKNILIALLLIMPTINIANCQTIVAINEQFQTMAARLPNAKEVGITQLVAYYNFTYPVDNYNDGFAESVDVLKVQISTNLSKTYSDNLHKRDRNLSFGEQNGAKFRFDYFDAEVFNYVSENKITVQKRLPLSQLIYDTTEVVEYSETQEIEWTQNEGTAIINGYQCLSATASIAGRMWRVWYTLEIPTKANLWRFTGLPGLVILAEDESGEFKFDCSDMNKVKEPILIYDWDTRKMSKTKWLKIEREMYTNPDNFFNRDGKLIIMDNDTHQPITETWSVRYNPLELN